MSSGGMRPAQVIRTGPELQEHRRGDLGSSSSSCSERLSSCSKRLSWSTPVPSWSSAPTPSSSVNSSSARASPAAQSEWDSPTSSALPLRRSPEWWRPRRSARFRARPPPRLRRSSWPWWWLARAGPLWSRAVAAVRFWPVARPSHCRPGATTPSGGGHHTQGPLLRGVLLQSSIGSARGSQRPEKGSHCDLVARWWTFPAPWRASTDRAPSSSEERRPRPSDSRRPKRRWVPIRTRAVPALRPAELEPGSG